MNGRRSKTILLIEDNPDDVELLKIAMEENGVANELEVAQDGLRALARLFDPRFSLPAVVLLDVNLPRMGGLEVLRQLRQHERTRALPVVILTTSREDRDLADGYRLGANSYVRKPIDFTEFLAAARQLGIYWLMINEVPKETT